MKLSDAVAAKIGPDWRSSLEAIEQWERDQMKVVQVEQC
jgi:hypothetical protein